MLLERDLEPVRPLAAHADAAHPRQLLEGGARRGEIEREEVARAARACTIASTCAARDVRERAASRAPRAARNTGRRDERSIARAVQREQQPPARRTAHRRCRFSRPVRVYPTCADSRIRSTSSSNDDAARARRHRHQAVVGHARRGVHLEQRTAAVGASSIRSTRPQPLQPSAGTPRSASAWIALLLRRRQAARAEVLACRR